MKNFKFWAIALVAILGLNSCSEDCDHDFIEHDYSQALVGTWTCMDNDFAETMVIKADGSVEVTGVVDHEFFESKGTIKVVNNKMIYKLDNGDEWEGRFEMTTGESFTMVLSDELDIRYTYRYCENDLADEVVGMWVCNDGASTGSIQTFKADGTSLMTGMTPVGGVLNHESTYKVVGDLMFCMMPEGYGLRYVCTRIVYSPNGTALGDVMTHQSINVTDDFEVKESSLTFLRVKEGLNLSGKTYAYNSAYVSNAKGKDEDFNITGSTFNMANIKGGDFDMMFRAVLFCVDLKAESIKQHFLVNGVDSGFDTPITVDGNKVTLEMSAGNPAFRDVEIFMFQDADDSQLHMYMPTSSFINYFANLEVVTLLTEGKIDPTDAAAVAKVYADMEARVESINVSFVMKAIEEVE
jgi:hypothetical protein